MQANWRRHCGQGEPEIEYCELEELHFYPGEGPCVDGFYYWVPRQRKSGKVQYVKRIPLDLWRQWGKRNHAHPREKSNYPAMKLELFTGYDAQSQTQPSQSRNPQ